MPQLHASTPITELSLSRWGQLQALAAIAFSAFVFSITSLLIKVASSTGTHSLILLTGRSFFAWALNIPVVQWNTPVDADSSKCSRLLTPPTGRRRRMILLARCLFGNIELMGGYFALSKQSGLTLADATSLVLLAPVFTFIIGRLVLKEPVNLIDVGSALLSIAGALIVIQPPFVAQLMHHSDSASVDDLGGDGSRLVGIAAAIASAAASAGAYTCVRCLDGTPATVIVHWFTLTAIVVPLSFAGVFDVAEVPSSPLVWGCIVAMGCCSVCGQLSMTYGMQKEDVGPGATMRYIDIVFVFIWGTLLLDEPLKLTSIVGATLIVLSSVIIALNKLLWKSTNVAKDNTDTSTEEQELTAVPLGLVGDELDSEEDSLT